MGRHSRTEDQALTDTPPDRLSNDPRSPFFSQDVLSRGIGIRFKGVERQDVEEYCVPENWVRVALGKKMDRHGRPLTLKLSGEVEPYYLTPGESEETTSNA